MAESANLESRGGNGGTNSKSDAEAACEINKKPPSEDASITTAWESACQGL